LEKCFAELERDFADPSFDFHLIKPQFKVSAGGGPNFFIKGKQDIIKAKTELLTHDLSQFKSIWRIHSNQNESLNGRIMFDMSQWFLQPEKDFVPCTVEVTSATDVREIEKYPNSEFDYFRLSKSDARLPFQIDDEIVKDKNTALKIKGKIDAFDITLRQRYGNFVDFAGLVKSAGGNAVSFDFWHKGKDLSIFDWDCNNEAQVLHELLKPIEKLTAIKKYTGTGIDKL